HEQAIAASSSLLLTWLNLTSQADINYKTSKNQRLLIELCLMKMAHVHSVLRPAELSEAGLKKKISLTSDTPASAEPASASVPSTVSTVSPPSPPIASPRSSVSLKTPRLSELVGSTRPARNGGP